MWICAYARAYTFFLKTIILFSSAPWDATPYRVAEVLTQIYNHYFFLMRLRKKFFVLYLYTILLRHTAISHAIKNFMKNSKILETNGRLFDSSTKKKLLFFDEKISNLKFLTKWKKTYQQRRGVRWPWDLTLRRGQISEPRTLWKF
jgi:hypothetical protein